jgi:glutathione S-transferase
MELYGIYIGPYVRKVHVTLNLKQLSFEQHPTMPGDLSNKIFASLSPLGKVPGFKDGALGVADSTVICEYLDEQYPQIGVYPEEVSQRAKARWIEEYADSKIAEVCGPKLFFERIVKPSFMGEACNEAVVQANLQEAMPGVLDYMESTVVGLAGDYLFADLGVADISIATHFTNARYANFTVDESRWPAFAAYLRRVWDHPAYREALAAESDMVQDLLTKAGL